MKSILDKDFVYVPSTQTDLRKTFTRIRKEIAKQKARPVETDVVKVLIPRKVAK